MALANVAAQLAKWGHRVLVVDWDLEAPGLETFFERWLKDARRKTPGIVDLLLGRETDWRACILKAQVFPNAPPVELISAGKLTESYFEDVQALDWRALFERGLGNRLDRLRNEWGNAYDFVLIDSRTGINDVGGICTVLLPDIVVLLFTTSEQSVDGVVDVMRQAQAAHQRLPTDRGRLLALPVPSRDESRKYKDQAEKWRQKYAAALGEYYAAWAPRGVTAEKIVNRLYIPYFGEFSFGEQLPVVDAAYQLDDPNSIGYAYARLATLIAHKLDWDAVLGSGEGSEAAETRAKLADAEARIVKGKRRGSFIAAAVLLLIISMVVVGQLSTRQRERRARAQTIIAAMSTTSDPLLAALLAAELQDLPDPGGGVAALGRIAASPIPVAAFEGPSDDLTFAWFSADGSRVIVERFQMDALLVYPARGRGDAIALPGRSPRYSRDAFTADGTGLITVSGDRGRIWRLDGSLLATLPIPRDIAQAEFASDGRHFFTRQFDNPTVVDLWRSDSAGPRLVRSLTRAINAAFTGDGSALILGYESGVVEVRDLQGSRVRAFPGQNTAADHFAPNRDGSRIAVRYRDGSVRVLPRAELVGATQTPGVTRFADPSFSPGGEQLLFMGADSMITLQTLTLPGAATAPTGAAIRRFGRIDGTTMLGFSHDGRAVFAREYTGRARVWRLDRSDSIVVEPGRGYGAALDSSGALLATAAADGSVRVWPTDPIVRTGSWSDLIRTLRGATSACLSVMQRAQFLGEAQREAQAAFERCERSFGRTPGRSAALADSLARSGPRAN